jgi:1-acyl-sn-glycerol-3-phosphate acyltransferase
LYRLLGGFHVEGLENVPRAGPAILAPNHHSWADPPAIRAVIDRPCWFMGNDFLFDIPVLGKLLPHYGAFPVHRGQMDRAALHTAEQHLKDGDLLVVFPEGGTTMTGVLYPFEGGVALLSLRTGVPIIPVGITGTDKLLPMRPPYYPRWTKGGVTLRFGKAIDPAEIDRNLPRRVQVERLTERLYHAVAELLPDAYLPEELRRQRTG